MIVLEFNKSKIDILKGYLNHLLVLIVGVGGSSFSMLTKHKDSFLVGLGMIATIVFIIFYGIIAKELNKTLKDLK